MFLITLCACTLSLLSLNATFSFVILIITTVLTQISMALKVVVYLSERRDRVSIINAEYSVNFLSVPGSVYLLPKNFLPQNRIKTHEYKIVWRGEFQPKRKNFLNFRNFRNAVKISEIPEP